MTPNPEYAMLMIATVTAMFLSISLIGIILTRPTKDKILDPIYYEGCCGQ
jgi:hypothetical protein